MKSTINIIGNKNSHTSNSNKIQINFVTYNGNNNTNHTNNNSNDKLSSNNKNNIHFYDKHEDFKK